MINLCVSVSQTGRVTSGQFKKILMPKENLLAFGDKTCGLNLRCCLNDISIKLIHFYKRCVSKTVVKPQHFLRADEGSHISPFLIRAEEGSLPRKQNKL